MFIDLIWIGIKFHYFFHWFWIMRGTFINSKTYWFDLLLFISLYYNYKNISIYKFIKKIAIGQIYCTSINYYKASLFCLLKIIKDKIKCLVFILRIFFFHTVEVGFDFDDCISNILQGLCSLSSCTFNVAYSAQYSVTSFNLLIILTLSLIYFFLKWNCCGRLIHYGFNSFRVSTNQNRN